MTGLLPEPVALDMPPGDSESLADLVDAVTSAALHLAEVHAGTSSPAAGAPGWRGADAEATAVQIAVVTRLAAIVETALRGAGGRLEAHRERLLEVRARVAVLREEQLADHARARARVQDLLTPFASAAPMGAGPDLGAVEAELVDAEQRRARLHETLLEELTRDATETARFLAAAGSGIGARGRGDDPGRVFARLAAQLPGWGDRALAERGRAYAETFTTLMPPDERDALASLALPYAGSPAFAQALLSSVGVEGMRDVLYQLGDGSYGGSAPLARLVATVLGAATPSGDPRHRVDQVLSAVYAESHDLDPSSDLVVLGMGSVLAASASGALRPMTVAAWGRQVLARETWWAGPAIERASPLDVSEPPVDAVPLVLEHLAAAADPAAAAFLLSDADAWRALLTRSHPDGGSALAAVISAAGAEPQAVGRSAVRAGLEALGSGLRDPDPEDWTVDRGTAGAVAGALGAAAAGHPSVVVGVLTAGVDGCPPPAADNALRGLGYLSLDPEATEAVEAALQRWAVVQPVQLDVAPPGQPLPIIAVPSAWLAVREYGQRLAHALHGFEQARIAEDRTRLWNWTVGFAVNALPSWPGQVAQFLEPIVARLIGMDGTWDNGADQGLRFDADDAVAASRHAPPPGVDPAWRAAVTAQARTSFDRVAGVLGVPEPPVSPEQTWLDTIVEALPTPDVRDRIPAARTPGRAGPD